MNSQSVGVVGERMHGRAIKAAIGRSVRRGTEIDRGARGGGGEGGEGGLLLPGRAAPVPAWRSIDDRLFTENQRKEHDPSVDAGAG